MANRPTKNSLLRDQMGNDWAKLWDSGTVGVYSAAHLLLVEFPLHTTAYLTAVTGKSSLHGSSKTTQNAVGSGTANYATIRSASSGTTTPAPEAIMAGRGYETRKLTVGVSGAHVLINNTSIEVDQPVTLNQLDHTESDRMKYIII